MANNVPEREMGAEDNKFVRAVTRFVDSVIAVPSSVIIRIVGLLQLCVCNVLGMYCLFNGRYFSGVDSVPFYLLHVPFSIAIMYSVFWSDRDKRKSRLLLAYVIVTMVTGLISSFYFMVTSNDLEITRRECSLTVLQPLAKFSAADCAKMIDEATNSVWRTAFFIITQVICIHPSVSYVITNLQQRHALEAQEQDGNNTGPASPVSPNRRGSIPFNRSSSFNTASR